MKIHIDVETFSSVDIKTNGAYKYTQSLDFEILIICYTDPTGFIKTVDLASGEPLPEELLNMLKDPNILKCAHNATFERLAFKAIGIDIPINQWRCSAVKSAYCGLPLSLDNVSKALNLGDKSKSAAGKNLIKFFSCPIKPTKINGFRERNLPHHNPEKWEEYKEYCKQDVVAEMEIDSRLDLYELPEFEINNYIADQEINDRGILIDMNLAESAIYLDELFNTKCLTRAKELTGLQNPNSAAQLKTWLSRNIGEEINSLTKESVDQLIKVCENSTVLEVLNLRKKLSKTSIKKYKAMINCAGSDGRARGLFQFYGANRTGRWAGRLIQLQNLPRNYMSQLELARDIVLKRDLDLLELLFEDVPKVLSELIRTAFIAKENHTLVVSDFSAIEARVLAWLAEEKWRIDIFNTHGKIYEASASAMFGVPIDEIKKGSSLRDKGKIAELALGYQGGVGAMKNMGGEKMGLSESDMTVIVEKWREANPQIVKFWWDCERCAKAAVKMKKPFQTKTGNIIFDSDGKYMTIKLPSGKSLYYVEPSIGLNRFGKESIKYKGMIQEKNMWGSIETYGGKLTENIVQAVSRDLLAESILVLKEKGFEINMHVHDEIVAEELKIGAEGSLKTMENLMCLELDWTKGLPLAADGYCTD
ncbi:MAG: DNA polymerase, partial [Fusobacteriaceae bacterium]